MLRRNLWIMYVSQQCYPNRTNIIMWFHNSTSRPRCLWIVHLLFSGMILSYCTCQMLLYSQICLSKLFLPLCVSICNRVESQKTGAISLSHLLWEDLNNRSTGTEYSTLNLKTDTTCKKGSSLKNACQQRLIQCVSVQTLWFWDAHYIVFVLDIGNDTMFGFNCAQFCHCVLLERIVMMNCVFFIVQCFVKCLYLSDEICNITFLMKDFHVNLFNFLTLYHILPTHLHLLLFFITYLNCYCIV